jgi:rod shape-determining protein MreC
VVIATILLMTYQSQRGALRPLNLISPPLSFLHDVLLTTTSSFIEAYRMVQGQDAELRALKTETREMKVKLLHLKEMQLENERLLELLYLGKQQPGFVAVARVISRSSDRWSSIFTIDKGSRHDIKKDMAVITPDGLLGKIKDVSPLYSKVLLIDDPRFSAAVRFQTDRSEAVLQGKGIGRCILKYVSIDYAPEAGDTLVTSGLDAMFPPGISAGYVTNVYTNKEELFHDIEAVPFADTRKVEEVVIVTR